MPVLQITKAKFSHAALRNAKKPHAACAAFAQALYLQTPSLIDIKDTEKMENWSVGANPQAREAIEEMKYTHRVRRVPAYDISGKLIHPLQYRESRSETLMGAIVRATVTLKHWNITQRSQDSYTADIKNIRFLPLW
ncbi:hypothetical protein K438DRAFT_1772429 [Mycena galopus ATCC 62051]|nr:hypothetical protein K438DRAFT_1778373 [Mycena galopus ATCC 62051]KAF8172999.1 hypothetical protein K438DRAFT_1772429 [Mycena galopus ATCC 62051]